MTKTIQILIFLIFYPLFAGELHAAERNFAIGSFDHVRVEGNLNIFITTGSGPKVSAIGSKKQLNDIQFTRNGRTLKIQSSKSSSPKRVKDLRAPPMQIFIETRSLENIFINGNSVVKVGNVKSKLSKYTILGSGNIIIDKVDIGALEINISGSGIVNLESGDAQKSKVKINGSGAVKAKDFATEILDLVHEGPANSVITVTNRANVSNNGTGRIEILGDGNCIIKSIGSGTILCENINL